VVNRTELTGTYEFLISWAWEHQDESRDARNASLTEAVQAQLGLKLQPKRGQGEVVVVDQRREGPHGELSGRVAWAMPDLKGGFRVSPVFPVVLDERRVTRTKLASDVDRYSLAFAQ
jgi:hypothetical protein